MSSIVVDANMRLFAKQLNISSSKMIDEYATSTIDEIIEEETKAGNMKAAEYVEAYSSSPQKLIELFRLMNVENRFRIINNMDEKTQMQILPMLSDDDLQMGLYFFKQEKLLKMLLNVDTGELAQVALDAIPKTELVLMIPEEDLAMFFMNKNVNRVDVMEQLQSLPPDVMQKFIESVTGNPSEETDTSELLNNLWGLSDKQFSKFMASVDPFVQRYLLYNMSEKNPEYLTLFDNEVYVNMLATLPKPDMVKSMRMLSKDTMLEMVSELPKELMSIVSAQVKAGDLAMFLQKGNMKFLKDIIMV